MSQLIPNNIEPKTDQFMNDVLRGLQQPQKELSSKYFYDTRGSCLFDQICELEEYYVTRTELSIMKQSIGQIVTALGQQCLVIEYGSGNGQKIRYLLEHLIDPVAYIPIDVSKNHLYKSAEALSKRFQDLEILPVCADFTAKFELPTSSAKPKRTVVYFPGSTIGNFHPPFAKRLLSQIATQCGSGGALLIGIALRNDREILERAYNDQAGVTADFNLNILRRINDELGANFHIDRFSHKAVYNSQLNCIEMHLVSLEDQRVKLDGVEISFDSGETICTEYSYKYSVDDFHDFVDSAGFDPDEVWTDERNLFAVFLLKVR